MFGQTRALCAEYVFIYFVRCIETNSFWKRKKKLLFVVVLTEN